MHRDLQGAARLPRTSGQTSHSSQEQQQVREILPRLGSEQGPSRMVKAAWSCAEPVPRRGGLYSHLLLQWQMGAGWIPRMPPASPEAKARGWSYWSGMVGPSRRGCGDGLQDGCAIQAPSPAHKPVLRLIHFPPHSSSLWHSAVVIVTARLPALPVHPAGRGEKEAGSSHLPLLHSPAHGSLPHPPAGKQEKEGALCWQGKGPPGNRGARCRATEREESNRIDL